MREISEKTKIKIETFLRLNKDKAFSISFISEKLSINKNTVRKLIMKKVELNKLIEIETVSGRKYYIDSEEVLKRAWK